MTAAAIVKETPTGQVVSPQAPSAGRDPRLDFFRGSAMFFIYVAHCRGDALWNFIPARYGLSDAADEFVFLSGMAASIAFGGSFLRFGAAIGTARILHRCWQLLVAHLGLFFTCAMVITAGTRWFGDTDYATLLDLQRFFSDPGGALIGIFTLTYVPHYFDILPLYIVVLAMVPAVMLLARIHPLVPIIASVALYLTANWLGLDLPAHADEQPYWYFDPFAWQLIFFTGFALRRGWIRVPLDSKLLLWGSVAIVLAGLAISLPDVFELVPPIDALRIWIMAHSDKTYLDPLQYFHFLALAYLAVVVLKGREQILLRPPLRLFVKCGQQALAIYVSCEVLAHIGGMIFDHAGTGLAVQVAVNGVSFAAMFAIAFVVAWFKAPPWKRKAAAAVPVAAPPVPSGAPVASLAERRGARGDRAVSGSM